MRRINLSLLIIFGLNLFGGCNPKSTELKVGKTTGPRAPSSTVENLLPTYTSRNFEQMIQIYSKLTGIQAARTAIRMEIEQVRAQLPVNNDPSSYSAFNQIAITSLAFRYCQQYVYDRTNFIRSGSGPLNFNVLGVDDNDLQRKEKIAQKFIDEFAVTTIEDDPFLADVKQEMISVMTPDSTSVYFNVNWDDPRNAKVSSAVTGCALFLASSYFTFD